MREDMEKLIGEAARVLKTAGAREVYVFGSAVKGEMRDHQYFTNRHERHSHFIPRDERRT